MSTASMALRKVVCGLALFALISVADPASASGRAADCFMQVAELSVRRQPSGGEVDQVHTCPADFTPSSKSLIVLIHGFNDDVDTAQSEYAPFLKSFLPQLAALGDVCVLYWPSDVYSPSGLARNTTASAVSLDNYIAGLSVTNNRVKRISLITESLGGRVALEMMDHRIRSGLNPDRSQQFVLCMMDSGVPVARVVEKGELRAAAESFERSLVLYSPVDIILWLAPLGWTIQGEGFLPRAVGTFGEPTVGLWTECQKMPWYQHSDYWKKNESGTAIIRFLQDRFSIAR